MRKFLNFLKRFRYKHAYHRDPEIMKRTDPKKNTPLRIRRDIKAWESIRGIWRGKKIKDPVLWQREIRKEWERVLP